MSTMDDFFTDFNVPELTAGVDEVGRGPLCGDVVTAAVILDPENPIAGLNDSKKLTEKRREALFDEIQPEYVLVDGNKVPKWPYKAEAVVKGDSRVPAIAAASILAKVTRDREMVALDSVYPGYGIAGHKGYPTKVHMEALQRLGVTPIHRRSYAPVRAALESE